MKLHIAKEGDTLDSLSKQYGTAPERIAALNPHIGIAAIARGEKVKIPYGPVSLSASTPPAGNAGSLPNPLQAHENPGLPPSPIHAMSNPVHAAPNPVHAMTNPVHAMPSAVPNDAHMQQNIALMPTASQPAVYKTEPAAANQSPLHVKWSGMPDAVHPYMPMPLPAAPAGAFAYPNDPWMYAANSPAMPQPGQYGYPSPFGPAAAPYAAFADPFPPLAPFAPFPSAVPVAGAYGECGCGSHASQLPYALPPLAPDAPVNRSDDGAAQVKGSAAAVVPAEPIGAPPAGAASGESGTRPRKQKPKAYSRSDSLRELLRRKGAGRKRTARRSRPWMID